MGVCENDRPGSVVRPKMSRQPRFMQSIGLDPSRTACTLACGFGLLCLLAFPITAQPAVRVWTTSLDLKSKLTEGPKLAFAAEGPTAETLIHVDPNVTFQTILGLGSSLEHSTCSNLFRLPPSDRERVIDRLANPAT